MYGFGDDAQPYAESIEVLEDLVIEYIQNMVSGQLISFKLAQVRHLNHFIIFSK
jgi:hypothetical protein